MDNNIQIQQLINSRKLSTNEEYVLFEGALKALQMRITIDDIAEICKGKPLECKIDIECISKRFLVVRVSITSAIGKIFYGTEHLWSYGIDITTKEIVDCRCIGGSCYGVADKQFNILENIPKLLDFIIDNRNDIIKYSGNGCYTCFVSTETCEIIVDLSLNKPYPIPDGIELSPDGFVGFVMPLL